MGGIGFAIDLEPAGDAPDPKGLYDAMYAIVESNIRKLAKGKPYNQVTEEYLSLARDDGWGTPKEIFFNFKDSGGCNMSADACHHWFELLAAALREKGAFEPLAASHDVRLRWKKPKPLKDLLARCDEPLVELRGKLFSTGKHGGEIFITSDDEEEPITIDDLSKAERAKVVGAFTKKKCACKVCAALRSKPALVLPKPKKEAKPKTTSKKAIKRYGTSVYFSDADATALDPRRLRGKIRGLQISDTPLTDLPDDLDKHPLDWIALRRTMIAHVPDVLARIASLRYFSIAYNPVPLAELAKIPQIARLVIDNWPGVPLEELPFAALPNLEELVVRYCELRELPPLGSLKKVDLTNNAFESVPDAIMRVASLEELELDGNRLTSTPRSWATLPRLRKLDLFKAPIKDIGEGLDALEELDLAETKVERLAVSNLRSLRVLHASQTPLREIDALPAKLETLALASTSITTLPDVRAARDALKVLRLSQNKSLQDLPEWLGELAALEELQLDDTAITRLPESMQKLRKLRVLGLRSTKVFPLPDWFAKLTALEQIDVYRDDLPKGEAGRLKKLLPKTKIRII